MRLFLTVITFLFVLGAQSQTINLDSLVPLLTEYTYSHNVNNGGDAYLFWTPNPATSTISFAVAWNTDGADRWVGLGISDQIDQMVGSFAVLSSTTNGFEELILTDRDIGYSSFTSTPGAVVGGTFARSMVDQFVVLEYERLLDSGNPLHRVISLTEDSFIITAVGNDVTPESHLNRYSTQINLGDGTGASPLLLCTVDNCDATGGQCIAGSCVCNDGFQGADCSEVIDTNAGDVSGYQQNATFLDGNIMLYWNLPDDVNAAGALIDFAIMGLTDGWVGFGISFDGGMIGSEAVIGWVPAVGGQDVDIYILGAKSVSDITPITNIPLTSVSAFNDDGVTVIKFTRTLDSGDNLISLDGDTQIVVAYGTTRSLTQHATDARQQASINFISGESTAAGLDPMRVTHACMMVLGWGILLPIGALLGRHRPLIAKYNKGKEKEDQCRWWPYHPAFQASGYFLTLMGFILAIIMVGPGPHFYNFHTIGGLIITILGFIQVVFGRYRPHVPEGYTKGSTKPEHKVPNCIQATTCNSPSEYTEKRYCWENKHIWLGRLLPLFGFCVICAGFWQIGATDANKIGIIVYCGIVVLFEILLEIISIPCVYCADSDV
jgi:hypothetical protein